MKHIRIGALALAIALAISPICSAHSGRTDANGGHRDNKNKSGLGYYHYHCGGYPPHLHPNGVCPYTSGYAYSSGSGSSSGSSIRNSSASTQPVQRPYIAATNMRTFIDGDEVPTFAYTNGGAYIIAEDLKDYGYDLYWDDSAKTLNVYRNTEKPNTPIPMESYRRAQKGAKCFDISSQPVSVRLWYGDSYYQPGLVHNLNGYIAICVDELKCLGNFSWNGATETIHINR